MNCLCEAIGIALPGNGTIPAVYSKRLQLAKHAGMAIMDMVKKGMDANEALEKAKGSYGRFKEAVKYIDPRNE